MEFLKDGLNASEWEIVTFEDINKADYIAYYSKPLEYQNSDVSGKKQKVTENVFRMGGFVGAKIDEESGKRFIMLVNPFGCKFSVQDRNVMYYYRSLVQKRGGKRKTKKDIEKMLEVPVTCDQIMCAEKPEEKPEVKRGRGRPKKIESMVEPQVEQKLPRGRPITVQPQMEKRPRGRPRKIEVSVYQ